MFKSLTALGRSSPSTQHDGPRAVGHSSPPILYTETTSVESVLGATRTGSESTGLDVTDFVSGICTGGLQASLLESARSLHGRVPLGQPTK